MKLKDVWIDENGKQWNYAGGGYPGTKDYYIDLAGRVRKGPRTDGMFIIVKPRRVRKAKP